MTQSAELQRVTAQSSLRRLLRPTSVAIVGASPSPGSLGGGVLANLRRSGFSGGIHPVNPKYDAIEGLACTASVEDLPDGVDCVVLAVGRAHVPAAVRACAQRNVGGVIVLASGFAEEGEEGRAMQAEIVATAEQAGMALQGPNCLGTTNYVDCAAMMFGTAPPDPLGTRPGVAMVSQSGAMAAVVRVALQARGIGLSYVVSTGNEAALGAEDFLEEFLEDDHTRVVAMLMEQIRDPARFLALADRARALGKPIVLLHLGRTAAGAEAAQTHTDALSGDYSTMAAQVTARGVHLVDSLEALVDLPEMFIRFGPRVPEGGAMVVTESGAFRGLTLDFCAAAGLDLPQLPQPIFAALRDELPPFSPPSNPLDLTAQALVDPSLYFRVIEAVAEDPAYGSIVIAITLPSAEAADRKLPPIIDALRDLAGRKPVVFAMLGEDCPIPEHHVDAIRATGTPFFRSPERAFRALAQLTRGNAAGIVPPAERGGKDAPALPAGTMPEYQAKPFLAEFGLPFAKGGLATSVEEAVSIAEQIGWPVALKAQAADLPHKSDAGGVALDLRDAEALRGAWDKMQSRLAEAAPGLTLDGVLVETMAAPGVELIVGARNDGEWGPVILVGMGGVFTEILGDAALIPAQASRDAMKRALESLAGAALLGPYRGASAADVEAGLDIIEGLARAVLHHPEIAEVDLNPVVLHEEGEGASVIDALIVVL